MKLTHKIGVNTPKAAMVQLEKIQPMANLFNRIFNQILETWYLNRTGKSENILL